VKVLERRLAVLVGVVLFAGVCAAATAQPAPSSSDDGVVAAAAFWHRYVDADGRVVRHDQGGDTVSEGQAYAMLIAVGTGDGRGFDAVWSWAEQHLERPDGLLSWHWDDGAVVDRQPATDADVDAAWALSLAGARFSRADWTADARRLAAAVLAEEVLSTRRGPVLAAGPWAVAEGWVNPSYGSPAAFDALGKLTGDPTWTQLAASARWVATDATGSSGVVADWAHVDGDGTVRASAGPSGAANAVPVAGYEAHRVPIRFAIDCDRSGKAVAVRWWGFAKGRTDGGPAPVVDLQGHPVTTGTHPAALSAAAAAADAAGAPSSADRLWTRAADLDRRHPTYFGAALVALSQLAVEDGRLGGCPPPS
jgi:endoglucanase